MAAQLIHVVRHAHAGDPNAWQLDDDLRPLSERGIGQAERLPAALTPSPGVLLSSPSLRCVATLLPLARANGLVVTTAAALYVGSPARAMLAHLSALDARVVAGCTHGDVIEDLLGVLEDDGVAISPRRCEKGATWTLEVRDGSVSSARYGAPP